MGYLYYVSVILGLVALCLYLVSARGRSRLAGRPIDLADRTRKRRELARQKDAEKPQVLPDHERILQRELKNVPTPWGWPGSDVRRGGLRASRGESGRNGFLSTWIDHLISEKRTVDDEEYRLRKDASLRALLEDRYGRPVKPSEMEYRRVRPPLLRDPSRPYDQEDNFPAGRTEQIVAKLDRQPGRPETAGLDAAARKVAGLKDVKMPWGW